MVENVTEFTSPAHTLTCGATRRVADAETRVILSCGTFFCTLHMPCIEPVNDFQKSLSKNNNNKIIFLHDTKSVAVWWKDADFHVWFWESEFTQLASIKRILPRDEFGTTLLLHASLLYFTEVLGHKNMLLFIWNLSGTVREVHTKGGLDLP